VLLTGGTGFIGSYCLARLMREDCVIHTVNRSGGGPLADRVTWHVADLRDPDEARGLIQRIRPTHLLHSAWMAVPGKFWHSPENEAWLTGGRALVRAFGEAGGRRFAGVGTCAEYDWQQDEFIEDRTPIKPATPYGRTKAAMAEAAFADAEAYGFTAAWGRVFQPYGAGEAPQRLIPSVIAALVAGQSKDLSDGRQERDFIFAPDLADLMVRLLFGGHHGAFNVGTGRAVTLRAVIEALAARLGGAELLRFGAFQSPVTEPQRLVADMTKVATQLGWTAPTSLEAGLDEVVKRALGVARAVSTDRTT
jgi:nucleoside-diphosphate-sugar epimerase